MANFLGNRGGDLLVAGQVTTHHLDVEGSGQSKVNGLAHDVCGQEIKRYAREVPVECQTQISNVVSRGTMAGFQGDHDICVGGSGGAAVVIAQVNPGNRQADVIDNPLEFLGRDFTADALFDMIDQPRSLLDPCAGMGAHMQAKSACIHARKEILSQERHKQPRANGKGQEAPGEQRAMA